nr:MAG TPA: hypothetical protein [Caudoviricetes sp.]
MSVFNCAVNAQNEMRRVRSLAIHCQATSSLFLAVKI